MKLSQLPPLKRNGDLPLVFGIIFTEDEMRAHPVYSRDFYRDKPRTSTLLTSESSDEDSDDPDLAIDDRLYGVIMALKSAAKMVWKPSLFMRAMEKERTHHAITFAHNASAEGRELPPPETIEELKKVLGTEREPEWYYSPDEVPPPNLKGDLPLVFGIIFTEDEMRAHPAYSRDFYRDKPRTSTLLSSESDDEDSDDPDLAIDDRLYGVIMALKSAAKMVWKPSLFMRAMEKERTHPAITFAHNASPEGMELPPPETIERLKEVLGTEREPEWYYTPDDPLK